MALHLGEVVMAVDALLFDVTLPASLAVRLVDELDEDAIHHLVAVQTREFLGPRQALHVLAKRGSALRNVGKIPVGQGDSELLHQLLRFPDEMIRDSLSDAA